MGCTESMLPNLRVRNRQGMLSLVMVEFALFGSVSEKQILIRVEASKTGANDTDTGDGDHDRGHNHDHEQGDHNDINNDDNDNDNDNGNYDNDNNDNDNDNHDDNENSKQPTCVSSNSCSQVALFRRFLPALTTRK